MNPHEKDAARILGCHQAPPPDPEMCRRMMGDLRQQMADRSLARVRDRRSVTARLMVAGAVSLPAIAAVVYGFWLLVHLVFGLVLPPLAVTTLSVMFMVWAAVCVSAAYGSLPILGHLALAMREGDEHAD